MLFSSTFLNRVYGIGLAFSLILFVFDFLAFFVWPDTLFGQIFTATREQTPLTWLSAVAFLFLSLGAYFLFLQARKWYWVGLALVFGFFSMDDAVYLHERIAGYFRDHTVLLADFPSYIWMILYLPLLAFALGTLLLILWLRSERSWRPWILGAVILLAVATLLDVTDGLVQRGNLQFSCDTTACQEILIHTMRLFEEIFEVWAIGMLGYILMESFCLVQEEGTTARARRDTNFWSAFS